VTGCRYAKLTPHPNWVRPIAVVSVTITEATALSGSAGWWVDDMLSSAGTAVCLFGRKELVLE